MSYEEVDNYIENLPESDLITLSYDIYDWVYVSGTFKPNCMLLQISEYTDCPDTRYIAEQVMRVALKKLNNTVLLL